MCSVALLSIWISGEDIVPILPAHLQTAVLSAAHSRLREKKGWRLSLMYRQTTYKASGAAKRTRLEQLNWLRRIDSEMSWPRLMSRILKQKGGSRETGNGPGWLREPSREAKAYHTEADRSRWFGSYMNYWGGKQMRDEVEEESVACCSWGLLRKDCRLLWGNSSVTICLILKTIYYVLRSQTHAWVHFKKFSSNTKSTMKKTAILFSTFLNSCFLGQSSFNFPLCFFCFSPPPSF